MKKIVFTEKNKAEIEEVAIPVYGPKEVLLKVKRVGVCGSDMQVFAGRNRYMTFPVTPFHEGVLEVEAVGSEVSRLKPGMTVVVWPFINCGECYSCKKGRQNACMNFTCLGIQADGLGAEYYVSDERFVFPIPSKIDPDEAVLIEPLAIGIHAAKRGDVAGKTVMIVGGGTIGNLTAQACKICGATHVCICDISQDKVDFAKKSGISGINTSDKTLKEAAECEFDGFPDVIMDCAGAGILVSQMLEIAGKTTTVVIVANHSAPVTINLNNIQRSELDVRGCIGSDPEDFQTAIDAVAAGKFNAEGFITGRYHYDQVQKMMENAVNNRGTNMKTILVWDEKEN